MPAGIGSLTFTSWHGVFQAQTPTVTPYGRAGTVGTGIQVSAIRGEAVEIRTVLCDTLANCATHRTSAEALIGTIASATDALGRTFANTAVVSCSTNVVPARGLGGLLTHMCICQWMLIPEA